MYCRASKQEKVHTNKKGRLRRHHARGACLLMEKLKRQLEAGMLTNTSLRRLTTEREATRPGTKKLNFTLTLFNVSGFVFILLGILRN